MLRLPDLREGLRPTIPQDRNDQAVIQRHSDTDINPGELPEGIAGERRIDRPMPAQGASGSPNDEVIDRERGRLFLRFLHHLERGIHVNDDRYIEVRHGTLALCREAGDGLPHLRQRHLRHGRLPCATVRRGLLWQERLKVPFDNPATGAASLDFREVNAMLARQRSNAR